LGLIRQEGNTVPFGTRSGVDTLAGSDDGRRRLAGILDHVADLLPSQAPIRTFVHHNTLHAFEELPFEEAVIKASQHFGTEPYLSEAAFAGHLASGRILPGDLEAVLDTPAADPGEPRLPGGLDRRGFRLLRLQHLFDIPDGPALTWLLREGDALSHVHPDVSRSARGSFLAGSREEGAVLRALWQRLVPHAPLLPAAAPGLRPRDRLLAATGVDTDEAVHALLIRICGAFVDQGLAYWSMPERERGLLGVFRSLYGLPGGPPNPWMAGLAEELRHQAAAGWDAETAILDVLAEWRIPAADWAALLTDTLLSLRGWAGMIRQFEKRPDLVPVTAPPSRLMDYLAIQLLLDRQAGRDVERQLRAGRLTVRDRTRGGREDRYDQSVVYEAFLLAQMAGLGPTAFPTPPDVAAWVREVAAFGQLERRRLLHLAFERRYRLPVLDGLLNQARLGPLPAPPARAQVVCCIDDREESIRRHLEEVFPAVQTYGFAGFFGVSMAYQGLEDPHPVSLCPVATQPRHLVRELAVEAGAGQAAAARRRVVGAWQRGTDVGSRTLVLGSLLATLGGLMGVIPLIGRTLFPGLAEKVSQTIESETVARPLTRLQLERPDDGSPNRQGLAEGYTVAEMADLVSGTLRAMGLDRAFAPLVLIVGHGSSSLNNPHEGAYNCGATGGGCGGPNARAFAAMANHPAVRERLRQQGLVIPSDTWFIGAEQNTCLDTVAYFDLDLLPPALSERFSEVDAAFGRALQANAQERCRRFLSAPPVISGRAALDHVAMRAVDLGQPRPEYNHATNAVCVVGRRSSTRGLFLDRRAFLVSYEPDGDPDGQRLSALLQAVVPVCAGINLEYLFSTIDTTGYGCGNKIVHNIASLVGVMDGHKSDLRTGLSWQMVEIHEPVRLLMVIEAEPGTLARLLGDQPTLARLVRNHWLQLVAWSPSTGEMAEFTGGIFTPYVPESGTLPVAASSADYYRGRRDVLVPARITGCLEVGR
jgi:uncharacterized protein YbcC (UPF0753/DUF2309 family)